MTTTAVDLTRVTGELVGCLRCEETTQPDDWTHHFYIGDGQQIVASIDLNTWLSTEGACEPDAWLDVRLESVMPDGLTGDEEFDLESALAAAMFDMAMAYVDPATSLGR